MNAADIIAEMRVLPLIDPEFEIRRRIDFIKKQLTDAGMKTLVLGISGGIDSTTCGRLAQLAVDELNAIGSGYRFIAVRLPYATQQDETEAQMAVDFIKPTHAVSVNVKPGADAIHQATLVALTAKNLATTTEAHADFAKGNVKARYHSHKLDNKYRERGDNPVFRAQLETYKYYQNKIIVVEEIV